MKSNFYGTGLSGLGKYKSKLNRERQLILDLQCSWIIDNNRADLASNVVETGERTLEDYFGDIKEALSLLEPLGETYSQNNRLKLRIEAAKGFIPHFDHGVRWRSYHKINRSILKALHASRVFIKY